MKKQGLMILLLPLLLIGCSDDGSSVGTSISQVGTSSTQLENSSISSETSTKNGESSTNTSTPIPLPPAQLKTIAEVKAIGQTFNEKVNAKGLYISNSRVKLQNVQLIAAVDMISGTETYENSQSYTYKLIMSDDEGNVINVACNHQAYDKTSEYEDENQRYDVTGFVGYFNNQVEVFSLNSDVEYLNDEVSQDIDFATKANEAITLDQFYQKGEALLLNDKGVAYSDQLVNLKVKCLEPKASKNHNTNATFGAGDYILHAHSDRYFSNTLEKNKNYLITGVITCHKYRIGLEVASIKMIQEEVAFNTKDIELITIDKAHSYEFTSASKDPHPTNLTYTRFLEKPFKAQGYFGFIEGDEWKSIFDDEVIAPVGGSKDRPTWISLDKAQKRKVLYVHNQEYAGRTIYDDDITKLWGHIGELLEVTFLPYECQPGENHYMKACPYTFSVITSLIPA